MTLIKDASTQTLVETRGNAKLGTIVEPRLERLTLPIYRYIYI